MARLGSEELNEVVVSDVQPVPTNVVTLSSGVRVQFIGRLPTKLTQEIVVSTFQDANLGNDGQVRDNMSSQEQMQLANRMFNYNRAILSFALARGLIKLYDGMPKDNEWLDYLKINPIVKTMMPDIDFNSNIHKTVLYLLFFAFENDKDLELISEKLLSK